MEKQLGFECDELKKVRKNVEFVKSGKVGSPVKEEEDRDRNETR